MATLFFEGFDKGIIFNQLDPNYWSTQFKKYPKYAFGGHLPISYEENDPNYNYTNPQAYTAAKASLYSYNSPNNGILPVASYVKPNQIGYNCGWWGCYNYTPATPYPAFGSPPGFLAFSNIAIENNSNEYPTYLQASGFPLPSGNTTYLSMRCLGLESQHAGYSEYPYRHTLFSYNSGDVSQLTVNIVKITGTNNFSPINGRYETLALEVQQNNSTVGYFDLNIASTLPDYRIASIYNSDNTILTIAHTSSSVSYSSIISRWTHLEFSVDQSEDPPVFYINTEDINLPVVNFDNDIAKTEWDISLPISGFKFDNLRFYNRTYSSSISNLANINLHPSLQISPDDGQNYYYMFGKNWLLDDLALIDNSTPEPSYWLGASARVVQLVPGAAGSRVENTYLGGNQYENREIKFNILRDDWVRADGVRDWSTNSASLTVARRYSNDTPTYAPSHRVALSFFDSDNGVIEAVNSGSLDAVSFSPRGAGLVSPVNYDKYDFSSLWRESLNEAIGGVKIYNSARKKYLDTKFVNVFKSGVSDPLADSVSLLLHCDSTPLVDSTKFPKSIGSYGNVTIDNNKKFGNNSIYFPDSSSYLYLSHSDLATNQFTIESWVYFPDSSTEISLFDRLKTDVDPPMPGIFPIDFYSQLYGFNVNISGINYSSYYSRNQWGYNTYTKRRLLFSQTAQTGQWHHVALVRKNNNLICYLNGQSGVSYSIETNVPSFANSTYENENWRLYETPGSYNGLYSLNTSVQQNINSYLGNVMNGGSLYTNSTVLSIGKGGYIDEYRITYGINRYPNNFAVPNAPFRTERDDYVAVGPEYNVNKTQYRTYQHYAFKNPATNQNWTLAEINNLIFGVKKL